MEQQQYRFTATVVSLFLCFFLASQALAGPEDPEEGGQWGPVIDWPHIAVSAANLPDGRILTWSGSERETWPSTEQTYSATWDPATGVFEEVFHPTHNMFCAHLAMMEDGRVFVNGGRNQTNSPWTSIFDFRNNEWVQIENMPSGGRWYPTTIALANGDMFTAIGTASQPRYPEVWNVDTGWEIKNGVDFNDMVLTDYFSSGSHGESRWWPLLHVAPNGQIFHSGPTPKMHYIDPTGNGSYSQSGPEFTDWYHKHGTSIMYAEGKILNAGGWIAGNNIASSNQAFTVDLNGTAPVVSLTGSMNHARKFHNGIMLPNGEVLVVGGNTSGRKFSDDGAILSTEIWNEQTGTWRLGASMVTPRNYHSVALLMTDGRVLAAGSGYCSGNANCNGSSHRDGEVYSPSYLFDATGSPAVRPSIDAAPPRISSGEAFAVEGTPDLARFTMIKMSSTTHGMNTDVRFIEIGFTQDAPGQYTLQAHANPNVLTAGYWMLFGLDAQGVPSTAHVIQANTSGMPWINNVAPVSSGVGNDVNIPLFVGDADDDPLVLSATGLPTGTQLDQATQSIVGAATAVGTYDVTVTVNDNDEGTRSRSFQWRVFGQGLGSIRRDKWSGVSGTAVSDLTSIAAYPDSPTLTDTLDIFEIPTNTEDNFGTRVHGYLHPPVDGQYQFHISSDDGGELWLSTDNDPANRILVAQVPGWSGARQWDKFPEQQSALIELQAGQSYFIEALQKEGGGGDNLAVGWTLPGSAQIEVIPGANLSVADLSVRPPEDAQLFSGQAENVDETWQTVSLPNTYTDMVVIATPRYLPTDVPMVTQVRNAVGSSFELRVRSAASTAPAGTYTVDYLVAEAGRYDGGAGRFEAVKYLSGRTDENNSWVGEEQGYALSYAAPVVVGQVMSAGDDRFSVFWASDGVTTNPPSASSLFTGMHVAEDPTAARGSETIGYMVFESGTGTLGSYQYEAGLGTDSVGGVDDAPPYSYPLQIDGNVAVLSSAGMDGNNGGWPVLIGPDAVSGQTIGMAIDEDTLGDTERAHTNEQVAYVALNVPVDLPLSVDPILPVPTVSGTDATFSATAAGGDDLLYTWNFGDGTTVGPTTESTVTHSYLTPGRYVVTVTVEDPMSGEEITQTFVQLIHLPLPGTISQSSSPIALRAGDSEVWNVNPDNNSVAVIDATTLQRVAEVTVARQPVALQAAPNGEMWVVSETAATLTRIDGSSRNVLEVIDLPAASQPHGLVFDPSGISAYIALEATGEVLRMDVASRTVNGALQVGPRPRHLSISGDGVTLLVSRFITPPLPGESTIAPSVETNGDFHGGEVVMVATDGFSVTDTVTLRHSDRGVSEHSGPGVPNYLGPAVISPDQLSAWVPSKQDNILAGGRRGGQGMTFDQTVRAVTSKIDLGSGQETFWARVDHDNASFASHAAFGPYGAYLFTALEGNREIAVTDAYTAVELMRFDTGRAPQGLAISADGARLYVHNFMDRSVSVFDLSALTQRNELTIELEASVSSVASEALTAEVLRGKQLFYDARDPRLALDSYMSCASCHNDGGQDGRTWDFTRVGTATADNEGLRNTITLKGRAATVHGFLHWSGNFDEVQDFENQIRDFAGGTGLMADADFNAGTRSQTLGDPKAGISPDLDAMSAYLASLDEYEASPHGNSDGTLTAAGEAGRQLFNSKQCATCHAQPLFTDSILGDLHDIGTIKASSGNRLGGPLTGLDTPTLISVWNTAPYLHDGSAADVSGAMLAHSGISLSNSDLDQLSAYLMELDGSTAAIADPPPDPGCTDCVSFNDLTIVSYGGNQDVAGDFAFEDDGEVLLLSNNTWKRTTQTFEIQPQTVLTFDFSSTAIGEIHGVGFDADDGISSNLTFQVYGTQNWGRRDFTQYGGSGWQTFQIPVGQYYTGTGFYMTFVNDNDGGSGNTSRFRNIRLTSDGSNIAPTVENPGQVTVYSGEGVSLAIQANDLNGDTLSFSVEGLPAGLSMDAGGLISGVTSVLGSYDVTVTVDDGNGGSASTTFQLSVQDPVSCDNCVVFTPADIDSYGGQDLNGDFTISNQGLSLLLERNTWKRTLQTYQITPNTVIEFDFESSAQGEIHGIGFDENNSLSSNRVFSLYGTQNWGIRNFKTYPGSGRTRFVIPVGQFYTGSSMNLILVNDRDSGSGNNSLFSNIRIYEQ